MEYLDVNISSQQMIQSEHCVLLNSTPYHNSSSSSHQVRTKKKPRYLFKGPAGKSVTQQTSMRFDILTAKQAASPPRCVAEANAKF